MTPRKNSPAPPGPAKARNPTWTRDELILALDLFMTVRRQLPGDDPRVIELSGLLNRAREGGQRDSRSYRNANGVSMKLANFLRLEPSYGGVGLSRGGRLEAELWTEFQHDIYGLRARAAAIRRAIEATAVREHHEVYEPDPDALEYPEGRVLYHLHRSRERSALLSRKKKRDVRHRLGRLRCEACGFDGASYGVDEDGWAECHHRLPIAELTAESSTRLADLAIVCANCHRVLHRAKPLMTVEELSERIASRRGSTTE